jgi:hypothetical protein
VAPRGGDAFISPEGSLNMSVYIPVFALLSSHRDSPHMGEAVARAYEQH